jgi:hypothetical protein
MKRRTQRPGAMPRQQRHQRGAAALIVTMVLFFAMTLVAAYVNRNLVFEQRISANQYRATQAFEAAEAGLEWALAQLNNPLKLGDDCRPGSSASDKTFRERYLSYDADSARHTPITWTQGTQPMPLQPTCVRRGSGSSWDCSCPSSGHPSLTADLQAGPLAAFSIRLLKAKQPGALRVVAEGCTQVAGACLPGSSGVADANFQAQQVVALVPGLASAPAAPLTTKDGVSSNAALGLHNTSTAAGGTVLHAGGTVSMPNARLSTVPGGAPSLAVASEDATLQALSAKRFFSSLFGLDKNSWSQQPAVRTLICQDACNTTLAQAIDASGGPSLFWVEGDVTLEGPLTLGTPSRPVMLLARGAIRVTGSVRVHGLLHGGRIEWNDNGTGAGLLRGAATSETSYAGSGVPDLYYDAATLALLKGNSGSFARVPGSWRDF